LSKEALKMYGTPQSRAILISAAAMCRAWDSLSITHGPAMSAKGAPPPMDKSRPMSTLRVRLEPGSALGLPELFAGTDEAPEEGMGEHRLRFELGMELAGEEVGVVRDFHDFNEATIRGFPGHPQTLLHHDVEIVPIHLVPVTMPLTDLRLAVGLLGLGTGLQHARPLPEAHVAAHPFHPLELPQLVDHRVLSAWVELRRVRSLETAHVAGELDDGALQSQANPEERDLSLARVPDRLEHAGHPADAEPPGDENSVTGTDRFLELPVRQ